MKPYRTAFLLASIAVVAYVGLFATRSEATDVAACSQPVSTGAGPVASDCLFILNVAVGLQTCGCECDPNGDFKQTATDALTCLNIAVGVDLPLDCPCGVTTTTVDTTSTTVTTVTTTTTSTTTTTMGGPINPLDLIGIVTASRDRDISNSQFRGVTPLAIDEGFSLAGGFGILGDPGIDPDVTETTEEIAGCTVTTVEQITDLGGFGVIPNYTPLDPGSPGSASNGSTQLDLLAVGFGGYEPMEDPLAEGFDGGQTVQFSWPGGADINAFSNSIAVPPTVEITNPDLTDPGFDLVAGQAIDVSWVPGPDQDGDITIIASTATSETMFGGTSITIVNISVTISCEFPDASGSGTVPAAATAELQSSAPLGGSLTKSFSATRENRKIVSVSAPNVSGKDEVGFFGLSTMTRSITAGFSLP
jgi:hypothetical protein